MRFLREVAPGESGQDRGIGRQKGLLSRVWDRVRRRDAPSGGAVPHQPVGINHGSAAAEVATDVGSGWVMPYFDGVPVCDWVDRIDALKRAGDLEAALGLATGCMHAMIEVAQRHPASVMEHYVIQVTIIQHKMRAFRDEVRTIEQYLALGLPAARADHRINLHKRLAKAHELWAKAEGKPSAMYQQDWRRLVEEEKTVKQAMDADLAGSRTTSGRTAFHGTTRERSAGGRSAFVPYPAEFASRSFVAVDFETANNHGSSACQIGVVKFRDGRVVGRFTTLLRPPAGHDEFIYTHIHGITGGDVVNAPAWPEVAGRVARLVAGDPVYAHNASFDRKVWAALDDYFGTATLPARFYCSYRIAQQLLPGLENYKLPTVLAACAPRIRLTHHAADSDAEACGWIIHTLQQKS